MLKRDDEKALKYLYGIFCLHMKFKMILGFVFHYKKVGNLLFLYNFYH